MIAVKTPRPPSEGSLPGHQERLLNKFPAAMLAQDLPAPFSLSHPDPARAPSLEPTPSPAQVIQLGRSGEL